MLAGQEEKWAELLWAAMSEVAGLCEPGRKLELAEPGEELGREVAERLCEWLQGGGQRTEGAELAESGSVREGLGETGEMAGSVLRTGAYGKEARKLRAYAKETEAKWAEKAGGDVVATLGEAMATGDNVGVRGGGAAGEAAKRMPGLWLAEGKRGGVAGDSYEASGENANGGLVARWQSGLVARETGRYVDGGQRSVRLGDAGLSDAEIERICGVVLERICAGIDVYLQSAAVR